jgi:hypothetical protein
MYTCQNMWKQGDEKKQWILGSAVIYSNILNRRKAFSLANLIDSE